MSTVLVISLAACLTAEPGGAPACNECHGSAENPAPPQALGGFTDPGYRGVGAHQAHLVPGFSVPVACTECHRVPEAVEDTGHLDTPWPAEVTWEEAEIEPDAAEPFDGDALSCVVYCHGSTLPGGSIPNPVWTEPFDGAVCGNCHGFPPPPPHPASDQCGNCHPSPLDGAIDAHVDGELQVAR